MILRLYKLHYELSEERCIFDAPDIKKLPPWHYDKGFIEDESIEKLIVKFNKRLRRLSCDT